MVLSKRERYAGIAVIAVLAILALDQLLVEPLLAKKQDLDQRISAAQVQLERDNRLFSTSRRMNRRWAEMTSGGLKRDATDAESQVLHSVRDWAQDAGMALASLKPERTEKEKDFQKISLRATGAGNMQQIGRFLWRIQMAEVPVRITDMTISTRKEGTDDLALQLGISTIYLSADAEKGPRAVPAAAVPPPAGGGDSAGRDPRSAPAPAGATTAAAATAPATAASPTTSTGSEEGR